MRIKHQLELHRLLSLFVFLGCNVMLSKSFSPPDIRACYLRHMCTVFILVIADITTMRLHMIAYTFQPLYLQNMVLAVAVLFCVCITPPTVMKIYCLVEKYNPIFQTVTYVFLILNTSVNLILYVICSKTFRGTCLKYLRCGCRGFSFFFCCKL